MAQNGPKTVQNGPKHLLMTSINLGQKWQNGPKMTQNDPNRAKNGLKMDEWIFMTFIFVVKKKWKIDALKWPFFGP